jgi:hypothetical protein
MRCMSWRAVVSVVAAVGLLPPTAFSQEQVAAPQAPGRSREEMEDLKRKLGAEQEEQVEGALRAPVGEQALVPSREGEAAGETSPRLVDVVRLTGSQAAELARILESAYPGGPELGSLTTKAAYKGGSIVQGAVIQETDKEIILDKDPCEQKLAVVHAPYRKEEVRTVRCGEVELQVVVVLQQ